MSKENYQIIREKLNAVQKQLRAFGNGKQDILDCKELWDDIQLVKEKLECPKDIKTITIQYDIVREDVISNMEPENVINLWQSQNFHQGLADAEFPTHSLRQMYDVHIHILDGDKIIRTIIV